MIAPHIKQADLLNILTLVGCLVLIGPAALAANRRVWLRNSFIWLGILTFLVWIYQTFGPFK